MRELLQRHPLIVALGVLAAVLVGVLAIEAGLGMRLRASLMPTAPVKAAAVDAKLLPPVADAAPEQLYPETGSRPLFTPTRRPAPAAEAVGALVKGQFVLQGVTIMGDTKIAMLREKSGGRVYRVEKGREVANGVTVAEIEPERVTLRLGADSEVVALLVQKPGAPTAPVAAGPFGGAPTAPGAAPGAPAQPGAVPAPPPPRPTPVPGTMSPPPMVTPAPAPSPLPPASQPGAATPGGAATTAPSTTMTPEELLARRRARRAQQSQ